AATTTVCGRCSSAPASFGRTRSSARGCSRTGSSRRSRSCPSGFTATSDARRGRPDRDRPDPACARATRRGFQGALLHRRGAGVLRREAEPAAALRRPVRCQGGGRQGTRLGRLLHVEGDRDPWPAEAGRVPGWTYGGMGREARRRTHRALDDALPRARGGRRGGGRRVRLLPLLTAPETRVAEEAYPGSLDELME